MRPAAFAALLALASLPLAAHARHQAPATPAKVHRVEKLDDRLYCIFGEGGNIGLVLTDTHAVLIDDQFERLAPGLLEAIRSVTSKPIKYLVNTHHHGDHTGANVVLEKQVTAIVAHSNVRRRLETSQAKLEPAKRGGLPELAFGWPDPKQRAYLAIHLGGVEIHLAHFGPGHTDGDVLVGIPALKFMHLGDIFFNGSLPYIDTAAGGSLAGLLANVETVLSFLPEGSKLIPGHGPVGTHKDLVRYRDFLKAVQTHVKANPGKGGKDLDAGFDHAAWSDIKPMGSFLTWERFFDIVSAPPAR